MPKTIPSTPTPSTYGQPIGGGAGTVIAWGRPDLILGSPAGIGAFSPASVIFSAGNTTTVVAQQDVQHSATRHSATIAAQGLVLYTYGKAQNVQKPNQETGIALHAASGNVHSASLTAATRLTADKSIDVASTHGMVKITAPAHILLTAAGAAIDIQPGSITLKGPGTIEFKAGQKVFTGAGSASQAVELKKAGALKLCDFRMHGGSADGAGLIAVG